MTGIPATAARNIVTTNDETVLFKETTAGCGGAPPIM